MTDSEITTTILRQIRDEIITTRTDLKSEIVATRTQLKAELAVTRADLKAEIGITNERAAIVETVMRDLGQQLLMLTRYVKNAHGTAIEHLRKRIARLEKKVG